MFFNSGTVLLPFPHYQLYQTRYEYRKFCIFPFPDTDGATTTKAHPTACLKENEAHFIKFTTKCKQRKNKIAIWKSTAEVEGNLYFIIVPTNLILAALNKISCPNTMNPCFQFHHGRCLYQLQLAVQRSYAYHLISTLKTFKFHPLFNMYGIQSQWIRKPATPTH